VVGDGRVHAVHDELDALLDFGDLFWKRRLAELDPRASFIDEINRLVGQEAIGNVAIRVRNRKLNRRIGVADRVEFLVAVLDAVDDLDGVGFIGRGTLTAWKRRSRERSFSMDLRYSPGWWRRCTESHRG